MRRGQFLLSHLQSPTRLTAGSVTFLLCRIRVRPETHASLAMRRDEQHDGSGVKEGPGGVDAGLEIFGKPSVAADPGEEALDHPSARQNSKADLIRALGDDFDDDAGGGGDAFAGIAAISKDPLDERKRAAGGLQERPAAVAVLNAGRVRLEHQATPVRVNQRMTFAPLIFLPAS